MLGHRDSNPGLARWAQEEDKSCSKLEIWTTQNAVGDDSVLHHCILVNFQSTSYRPHAAVMR